VVWRKLLTESVDVGEMMRVLVTGANGFVGAALCERLAEQGIEARAASGLLTLAGNVHSAYRRSRSRHPYRDGLVGSTGWRDARRASGCQGACNAREVARSAGRLPRREHGRNHKPGTPGAAAGARRFVYVSTIKVNGERTADRPFYAEDDPQPEDAYAQSKLEAELALKEISQHSRLEVVIIRPPLVYGPGVKGISCQCCV